MRIPKCKKCGKRKRLSFWSKKASTRPVRINWNEFEKCNCKTNSEKKSGVSRFSNTTNSVLSEKLVKELETLLKYFKSDKAKKELHDILLPHLKQLQKETAKVIFEKINSISIIKAGSNNMIVNLVEYLELEEKCD